MYENAEVDQLPLMRESEWEVLMLEISAAAFNQPNGEERKSRLAEEECTEGGTLMNNLSDIIFSDNDQTLTHTVWLKRSWCLSIFLSLSPDSHR